MEPEKRQMHRLRLDAGLVLSTGSKSPDSFKAGDCGTDLERG